MTLVFNLSLAGYLTALLFSVANLFSSKRRFGVVVTLFLTAGVSASVLFTYFGVNYLLSGLRSYANA
jgi:ABC-type transport system involved in cytochrome c biogenesis permease subunit